MIKPDGRFKQFCMNVLPVWEQGVSRRGGLRLPMPGGILEPWAHELAARSSLPVEDVMGDALRTGALMVAGTSLGLWLSMSRNGSDLHGDLSVALNHPDIPPSDRVCDVTYDDGSLAVARAVGRGNAYDILCGGLTVMQAICQHQEQHGDGDMLVMAAPYDTDSVSHLPAYTACENEFYRVQFEHDWAWVTPPAPAAAP